jgi:hypothetical protein
MSRNNDTQKVGGKTEEDHRHTKSETQYIKILPVFF